MAAEYNVEVAVEHLPSIAARWPDCSPDLLAETRLPTEVRQVRDTDDQIVLLFTREWELVSIIWATGPHAH